MKQRFTSKQTSINSTKAPAVYSMKRAVNVMTGKTVVDIGGGRFDTAAEAARGDVVRLAATKAAALLITVYEGKRHRQTDSRRQLARKQAHR